MKALYTKVGDHFLKMEVYSSIFLYVIKQSFNLLDGRPDKIDCTLQIRQGYGQKFADYDVESRKDELGITHKRLDYFIRFNADYTEAKINAHSKIGLQHAFLNAYSTFIMEKNWGILLHSACIIESGQAHIFAGPSGTGKSTLAKLSSPRPLLSDEGTVLKVTDDGVFTMHSPFRSDNFTKASTEIMEKEWSVGTMQIIRQAKENKQVIYNKADAFLEIYPSVFLLVL